MLSTTIEQRQWIKIIEYCSFYDVENGESHEYMYSTLPTKNEIIIWTRDGWRDGWYQAKLTGEHDILEDTVMLQSHPGTAPKSEDWNLLKLEELFNSILSGIKSKEII